MCEGHKFELVQKESSQANIYAREQLRRNITEDDS